MDVKRAKILTRRYDIMLLATIISAYVCIAVALVGACLLMLWLSLGASVGFFSLLVASKWLMNKHDEAYLIATEGGRTPLGKLKP